jgi:hypothetical protein
MAGALLGVSLALLVVMGYGLFVLRGRRPRLQPRPALSNRLADDR